MFKSRHGKVGVGVGVDKVTDVGSTEVVTVLVRTTVVVDDEITVLVLTTVVVVVIGGGAGHIGGNAHCFCVMYESGTLMSLGMMQLPVTNISLAAGTTQEFPKAMGSVPSLLLEERY